VKKEVLKPNVLENGKISIENEVKETPVLTEVAIAVMDFQNNTSNKRWNYLEVALPDILSSDLSTFTAFKVVERKRISEVLKELRLGYTGSIDPATAQKIGKLIGANVMVMGSVINLAEDILITTRLVRVQTGEVIGGTKEQGKNEGDIAKMMNATATKISSSIQVTETKR
jgi:curli biogenesis system outer membrane secretion channel CsgG